MLLYSNEPAHQEKPNCAEDVKNTKKNVLFPTSFFLIILLEQYFNKSVPLDCIAILSPQ